MQKRWSEPDFNWSQSRRSERLTTRANWANSIAATWLIGVKALACLSTPFSEAILWSKSKGMSLQSCWRTVELDWAVLVITTLDYHNPRREGSPTFNSYGTLVALVGFSSER